MKRASKLLPWLYGFILSAFLFIILNHFFYFRYENSDDILIVKAFMGFEGGVPAVFQLYQHTLLSYFIGWISTLIPGVAWFSLLQFGCLGLSIAVISGSLCASFCNRFSLLYRILLSGIFAAVFGAFASARLNFTTTAAMLGAASIALLLTNFRKAVLSHISLMFSGLLLCGCYMIRAQSCLAVFPFWFLSFACLMIYHFIRRDQSSIKKLLVFLLAILLVFAALWGIRAFELRDPELRELIDFQNANSAPMDYAEERILSVGDSTLEEIGWSRAELALVQQWYFMDANITTEAFEVLSEALSEPVSQTSRLTGAVQTLATFFASNPRYLLVAVLLFSLSLLVCLLPFKDHVFPLPALAAVGAFFLTAAMLLYLALQGRFLSRAADCALFPAGVVLSMLAVHSLDAAQGSHHRQRVVFVILLLCVCLGACHAKLTFKVLSDRPDQVSAVREERLENYALNHPDKLILRTPNLLRDTRLFPDVSNGIPTNIMIWGDWNCRTPSWYHQLEALGFDGHRFSGEDFLNPALLFATEKDAPPAELMEYLSHSTGQEVHAVLVDTVGDIRFFSFQ